MHEANCFVTLTYDQVNVPRDGSLVVGDWQKFAKRVRKRLGRFRFFHCGEYGEVNLRPHYHALMFGLDFSGDRVVWKKDERGHKVYTSEMLSELWNLGFATVGELTWQSAAYVARYCMKKATGDLAKERYRRVDPETGEEWFVRPEYVTMSRRPGIGSEWYERFKSDVYPLDEVVHDGRRFRPPRYYDEKLQVEDPELMDALKAKRKNSAAARAEELEPARLRVRERVAESRLTRLGRKI